MKGGRATHGVTKAHRRMGSMGGGGVSLVVLLVVLLCSYCGYKCIISVEVYVLLLQLNIADLQFHTFII